MVRVLVKIRVGSQRIRSVHSLGYRMPSSGCPHAREDNSASLLTCSPDAALFEDSSASDGSGGAVMLITEQPYTSRRPVCYRPVGEALV